MRDAEPGTGRSNYLRFRLSPASASRTRHSRQGRGKDLVGDQEELYLSKSGRNRKLPTRGCWATPCTATEPSSPVGTRSR
jgi:hypothetical protein